MPDTAKMTIGDAVESYIKASEMSLKPSTLASYENIRKNYLKSLYPLPLLSVDNCQIQKAVNFELSCHARHTVVNSLSLLRAALEMFHPDFCLKVKLPKNQPKYKDFPTPEAVLQAMKGTEIETAALLSVWSTLRLGEIEGLQWKDIAADGTCFCNGKEPPCIIVKKMQWIYCQWVIKNGIQ